MLVNKCNDYFIFFSEAKIYKAFISVCASGGSYSFLYSENLFIFISFISPLFFDDTTLYPSTFSNKGPYDDGIKLFSVSLKTDGLFSSVSVNYAPTKLLCLTACPNRRFVGGFSGRLLS